MAIHRLLHLGAARRNTLAACLAAALATGAAGASGPMHHQPANAAPAHISSDEALFGVLHTLRPHDAQEGARNAGPTSPLKSPAQPSGTIVVTNCLDDGSVGSLREAFDAAQGGSVNTIDLSALQCPNSTITLTAGAIATAVHLEVRGPGQDALTIYGDGYDRVFVSTSSFIVNDLTIANGVDDGGFGGCIYSNGQLTLARATITGCVAGDGSNDYSAGGGVFAGSGLVMEGSTISNNIALAAIAARGGGAYASANAVIEQSLIFDNNAVSAVGAVGGGVFANNGMTIGASQVLDNTVESGTGSAAGGGLFVSVDAFVTGTTISGNSVYSQAAVAVGGGLRGGNIQLFESTIDSNDAGSGCNTCPVIGAGVLGIGTIDSKYSTISGNQALSAVGSSGAAAGGGMATYAQGDAGAIVIENSTISGNYAIGGTNGGSGYGGGIAPMLGSQFSAYNSTIAFNQASDFGGGVVGNQVVPPLVNSLNSSIVANNLAQETANDIAPRSSGGSFTIDGNNNLVIATGAGVAFNNAPLVEDPHLLPLTTCQDGATATHPLEAGSPAIDAGNNVRNFAYDQRRPPYARVVGQAADIGAFETQPLESIFGNGFEIVPLCP